MFNNNRVKLVVFAAVICIQMVHGTHYRKNKKIIPQGTVVAQIKAAQAVMPKSVESMQVIIPINPEHGLHQEADEERKSNQADSAIGCCVFTVIAGCTLLTAHSSL